MARQEHTQDSGFQARFDRVRARTLRIRVIIYCALALCAFSLSLMGDSMDWTEAAAEGRGASSEMIISLAWDGGSWLLYAAMLGFVLVARPNRQRLVLCVTLLTVVIVGAAAPLEGFLDLLGGPERTLDVKARVHAGWMSVLSAGFLVLLALVLVPMRVAEWMRIAAPAWVIACLSILMLAAPPVATGLLQCAAAGLAVGAGGMWSSWRFREFDERFRSREIASQLGDMAAELSYARQIHEALFPPPVEQGPVRVSYRYEPMRAIGGDFLFVWPLAFPPSEVATPVHVVIIDVTGHGVSAALTVNRLHDELRRFFAERPEGGAGRLIDRLNAFAVDQLAPHGVYATALCLRVDSTAGQVEWANAGHPPALVRRAAGLEELAATAPMLGVLGAEEFVAGARTMMLPPGQGLVAFTDGAFEAIDKSGRTLGLDVLKEIVATGKDVKGIAAAVAEHRSGPATDDLLVVEVARGEAGPAGS